MSQQVTQTHRTTYADNMGLLLQEKKPKLLRCVKEEDVTGDFHKLTDQVGEVDAQEIESRHSDTKYQDTPHDGRWIAQPNAFAYADLIDKHDKLASGIDVQGMYTMAGTAALNRNVTNAIIGGIFGNAQTGLKGTILTPFDTNNVVPVNEGGTISGLTVDKLAAAQEILRANFVDLDEDELWMALTARQSRELLRQLEATNKDYGATGAEIKEGKLSRLFGFNFEHLELGNPRYTNAGLTVDGSGYRKVPFWAKSGITCAFWERLFSNIEQLATKNYSVQVYARNQVAASRTEEGKVGYILCDES